MTAPARTTALFTLSGTMHTRTDRSDWLYHRDAHMGRELWIEPAATDGRRDRREVKVDEIPGEPGCRVVEGFNGYERILIRCTQATDPVLVLRTLDDWQVLPVEGVITR